MIIGGQPYKVNTTLGPDMQTVSYQAYLKSTGNPEELHWYMRGSFNSGVSTVFADDLVNFEYPLYLGKTWSGATTTPHPIYGSLAVTTSAVAVAYIEPVLDDDGNVVGYNPVVADGCSYQLPDLDYDGVRGDDIPLPRKELGDISWADMNAVLPADAHICWNNVVVPAGPHQGENIPGYYVVRQTIVTTATIQGYPVKVAETSMTVASRWTGNFPWYQYEFGGEGRTFAVRVKGTAIGKGGHTFQFTTPAKDFGCKHVGDSMKVYRKAGLITIDYDDEYITCDATMKRVKGDVWFGAASVKDLATGRTYVVFGPTSDL